MRKIVVIVGPTGVGKTKLSIELAKKYNGEIINADAMQVYRELDIGTAKIKEEEKENILHHLFDIKNVGDEYSIYHYQKDCRDKIEEICLKGKVPILVGGTGLYIKSALYDYQLDENIKDISKYSSLSDEELYQRLIELDPSVIGKIDRNNRRRVMNALIYYEEHQSSITSNKTNKLLYDSIFIGLTTDRENLYEIINKRVDKMMENGLLDEVKSFYDKNIRFKPLLSGIGYKELYEYLDGDVSLEDAVSNIKRNSRRYAKRQYTYFQHQLPVHWFETNYDDFSVTVGEISDFIDNYVKI